MDLLTWLHAHLTHLGPMGAVLVFLALPLLAAMGGAAVSLLGRGNTNRP